MSNYMDEFITTVIHISHFIGKNYQYSSLEHAVTPLQREAMKIILHQPKTTIGLLSFDLRLSMSSTTQLIDRLEKLGFVTKDPDANDRRVIHLSLTTNGEKELERLTKYLRKTLEKIFSNVSQKDINELIRINKALIHTLEKKHLS